MYSSLLYSQCYSLDDMLTVFGVDHSVGADVFDFKELCPAFIQQAKSGHCKEPAPTSAPDTNKDMGKGKFRVEGKKALPFKCVIP